MPTHFLAIRDNNLKLRIPPAKNTYDVLMDRWSLSNPRLLVKSKRAAVYKVDSPQGPAAFKLYTEIGYANERAAVAFSNNLSKGVGARILQTDFFRAAILIEWLEGPSLADTYHDGGYADATRRACEVVRKIATTEFRWAFAYRRLMPLLKQRLEAKIKQITVKEDRELLQHALELFEEHFDVRDADKVIHGDLHYANIIVTPQGVRAIDPKGVRAHPLFECRNLFETPHSETTVDAFRDRVLHQVAIVAEELGHDRKDMIQFNTFQIIAGMFHPKASAEETEVLRQKVAVLIQEAAIM